jgi:hypothetical protein
MVNHRSEPQDTWSPFEKASSALTRNLEAKAVVALDEARGMLRGHEYTAATHKALVLQNAVELHEFFSRKRLTPAALREKRLTGPRQMGR